jgi:hypothetical protein
VFFIRIFFSTATKQSDTFNSFFFLVPLSSEFTTRKKEMMLNTMQLEWVAIGLRTTQSLLSMIALATLAAGFPNRDLVVFGVNGSLTNKLGSNESNFVLLTTYTSMLYALWYLCTIQVLKMDVRPRKLFERIIDGVLFIFLMSGGIALAVSDYVHHCDLYAFMLRCNNLTASTVFVFLTAASFVASIALSYLSEQPSDEEDINSLPEAPAPVPYVEESTPVATMTTQDKLSPLGPVPPVTTPSFPALRSGENNV